MIQGDRRGRHPVHRNSHPERCTGRLCPAHPHIHHLRPMPAAMPEVKNKRAAFEYFFLEQY
ncbi:MAG TPA: hypothetical protein PLP28_14270, partial [Flavobacteriales bacterium]|nr:hypothetical protein [Flavobacteriales bacterium]